MGQVTIYIDDETEKKMLQMVKNSGLSKSKWITEIIKEKTLNSWPEEIRQMAGTWKDFPTLEEIRCPVGVDVRRDDI